jgi:predicted RNA-binding Zn-ribbon protein involved in translation (DUF1610 family)
MNRVCPETGKQQMSRSEALRKLVELRVWDREDQGPMAAYRCAFCGRHHVGHRRLPGSTEPYRRINA